MRLIEAVGKGFMIASAIWIVYIILKVAYLDWKSKRK